MDTGSTLAKRAFIIWLLLLSATMLSAQEMYWVGGSGNWNDPNHWVKESGGSDPAGGIPDADTQAFIDDNSGLNPGSTITLPPGEYAVRDLTVSASRGFTLNFTGSTFSQDVDFTVFGNLILNQ